MRFVLAVLGCLLATGVAAASAAPATAPPAQLTAFSCQRAVDPLLRGMSVTALMRPIPATRQLEMKAELIASKWRHGRYHVVHAPKLGHWFSPTNPPTLGQRSGDVWRVTFPILGLPAPAFYRLRVTFRWIEAARRALASETLLTQVCHQLELRPDLLVHAVDIYPDKAQPGEDRYFVVVRNRGATGAGPFAVTLTDAAGNPLGSPGTVAWLGPHAGTHVVIVAPACAAGELVTATADPTDQVLDYDRSNNSLAVACPATVSGQRRHGYT